MNGKLAVCCNCCMDGEVGSFSAFFSLISDLRSFLISVYELSLEEVAGRVCSSIVSGFYSPQNV